MPITEHLTYMQSQIISTQDVLDNGTWPGEIVDSANYTNGFAYALLVLGGTTAVGSNSTFTLQFEHGDDPALADAELVPAEMMIYGSSNNGVLPNVVGAMEYYPSPTGVLSQEGLFSTKRYVRANIIVTNWNGSGSGAKVIIFAIKHPDFVPVPQRLGAVS